MGLREQKKRRTRSEILRVAEAAFRARGFDGTRVRDIAAALHLSEQTVFNYFPSKEALLDALATSWYEALATRAESMREMRDGDRAAAAQLDDFLAGVRALLGAIAADRDYMHLLFFRAPILRDVAGVGGGARKPMQDAYERNRAVLRELFAQLQEAGVLRDDVSPDEVVGYYVTQFNASVAHWLGDADAGADALERRVLRALEVLFRGLRPDGREAA